MRKEFRELIYDMSADITDAILRVVEEEVKEAASVSEEAFDEKLESIFNEAQRVTDAIMADVETEIATLLEDYRPS